MFTVKIKTKLIIIAIVSSIMLLLIAGILLFYQRKLNRLNEAKERYNILSMEMMQREIDHLKWAQKLEEFLLDRELKEIRVEKDEHLCGFGKWYYGEARKEAVTLIPEVSALIEKIEIPHRALHQSATVIEEMLKQEGDASSKAAAHFRSQTQTHLRDVQALLTEIRKIVDGRYGETEMQVARERKRVFGSAMVAVLLFTISIIIMILLLSRSITRSIDAVILLLKDIAQGEGDLTRRLPLSKVNCSQKRACGNKECGEFGKESTCWDVVGSNAPGEIRCPSILSGKLKSCTECPVMQGAIRTEMDELSAWFNTFIGRISHIIRQDKESVDYLLRSSEEMSSTATELSVTTEKMNTQTIAIAASVEESSVNLSHIVSASDQMSMAIENVAASIEEMTATVNEISKNCQHESDISSAANEKARASTTLMNQLDNAFKNIEKVVNIINDIADQTNLLALNATIEAARAGEAGKGFAVVANEVKELAKQTGEATKEISGQIDIMKHSMGSMEASTTDVARSISDVSMISQMIVSAVGEISITINEISKNIVHASESATDVSQNIKESSQGISEVAAAISGYTQAVSETTNSANHIENGAIKLTDLANRLFENVGRFKV